MTYICFTPVFSIMKGNIHKKHSMKTLRRLRMTIRSIISHLQVLLKVYFVTHTQNCLFICSGFLPKSILTVENHVKHAAVTHIGGLFSPPVSQTTAIHQENIQGGRDDGAAKKRV